MKKLAILLGLALLTGLLMVSGLVAQMGGGMGGGTGGGNWGMGGGSGWGNWGPPGGGGWMGSGWDSWGGSWNTPPNPGGTWNPKWKCANAKAVLYLFPKDQSGALITSGPYGMLNYNLFGTQFNFQFSAFGMQGGTSYTLVYYAEPQPGADLIVLGTVVASANGRVQIKGAVNTGSLPAAYDANATAVAPSTATGAQIRLVLTADIDSTGKHMAVFNPNKYLFEYNLITFIDTNG